VVWCGAVRRGAARRGAARRSLVCDAGAVWCIAVRRCGVGRRSVARRGAARPGVVWRSAVRRGAARCGAVTPPTPPPSSTRAPPPARSDGTLVWPCTALCRHSRASACAPIHPFSPCLTRAPFGAGAARIPIPAQTASDCDLDSDSDSDCSVYFDCGDSDCDPYDSGLTVALPPALMALTVTPALTSADDYDSGSGVGSDLG
jgi:hypothetical protein